MELKKNLEERIKDAEAKSYFIPWYKRWWGRSLVALIIIFLFVFLYFIYLIFFNYNNIKKGNIYNEKLGSWITEDEYNINKKIVGDIMTEDDPWLGAKEPSIYIIGFESFGCPFCKDNQKDIKKMINKFGNVVRFISKDFPTEGLHLNVFNAHLAASCANDQGSYWEYRNLLFKDQNNFTKSNLKFLANNLGLNLGDFSTCLDDEKFAREIRQDYSNGVQVGVVGTPSYLVNGELIPGAITYDVWEEIIALIINQGI